MESPFGTFSTHSPDETQALGQTLGATLKPGAVAKASESMRRASPTMMPLLASPRVTRLTFCKMTMARLPMHIQFRPGWIIPELGLNIPGCMTVAGSIMSAPPMMKPWSLFSYAPAKKALSLPSNHHMRWPMSAP